MATLKPAYHNVLYFNNLFKQIRFNQGDNYIFDTTEPTLFPNKTYMTPHLSYRAYKKVLNIQNTLQPTGCTRLNYIGYINNRHYLMYFTTRTNGANLETKGYVIEIINDDNINEYNLTCNNCFTINDDFYTSGDYLKMRDYQNYGKNICDGVFNKTIYEELQYYPNNYLPSMLYLLIPFLLFIFAIKVFRKGLFR